MMGIFGELDLASVQAMAFPLIKAVGGPDIQAVLADQSITLRESAETVQEAADLLVIAADALEDGLVDNDEISAIVAGAGSVREAFNDIVDLYNGEEE